MTLSVTDIRLVSPSKPWTGVLVNHGKSSNATDEQTNGRIKSVKHVLLYDDLHEISKTKIVKT